MLLELRLNDYLEAPDRRRDEIADAVHQAFSRSVGLRVTDYDGDGVTHETVDEDLRLMRSVLSNLPVSEGFGGIDDKTTHRRSFGTVHELGRPTPDPAYIESQLAVTDSDPRALIDGMELLRERADHRAAVGRFNLVTDRIVLAVMDAIRRACAIPDDYFTQAVLPGSTCRLRAVHYDNDTADSSCGVHPDGNLLSVLFTDTPGFRYFDQDLQVQEPEPGGAIVLPGSLLYRWSGGTYRPVFHYVRNMSEASKTSVVYFYNLRPLGQFTMIPYRAGNPLYVNDIKRYKPEDVSRDGPFGDLFDQLIDRARYDVVSEGPAS
jgi:isopenicillin N synthase-like dioxygenase